MVMHSVIDVVKAVEAVEALQSALRETLTFWTANDFWSFEDENDAKVCDLCSAFDNQVFTGDLVKTVFPYATIRDNMTLDANIHPHCRCVLNRVVKVRENYYYVQRKA